MEDMQRVGTLCRVLYICVNDTDVSKDAERLLHGFFYFSLSLHMEFFNKQLEMLKRETGWGKNENISIKWKKIKILLLTAKENPQKYLNMSLVFPRLVLFFT